jgi:hypothetical protein
MNPMKLAEQIEKIVTPDPPRESRGAAPAGWAYDPAYHKYCGSDCIRCEEDLAFFWGHAEDIAAALREHAAILHATNNPGPDIDRETMHRANVLIDSQNVRLKREVDRLGLIIDNLRAAPYSPNCEACRVFRRAIEQAP